MPSANVLLIDDDPTFLAITKQLPALRAAKVFTAPDGARANKLCKELGESLALIVCDINMPDCDGIEFVQSIDELNLKAPLIVVSGAMPSAHRAIELLASAGGKAPRRLFRKPPNLNELNAEIESVLKLVAPVV